MPERRSRRVWPFVAGLLLVVLGAGVWVAYALTLGDARRGAAAASGLVDEWLAGCGRTQPTVLEEGTIVAALSFPGRSEVRWPVRYGITEASLDGGIGWYPDTEAPGEPGNMVVAGYRLSHGAPFWDVLKLDAGDRVVLETCSAVYTYLVDIPPRELTVSVTEGGWIFADVPGVESLVPTRALLTLTTSQDLLPGDLRAVGFAVLAEVRIR